jgi:hypothetical protein
VCDDPGVDQLKSFAINVNLKKINNIFVSYVDTASGGRNVKAHPLQVITGETTRPLGEET